MKEATRWFETAVSATNEMVLVKHDSVNKESLGYVHRSALIAADTNTEILLSQEPLSVRFILYRSSLPNTNVMRRSVAYKDSCQLQDY